MTSAANKRFKKDHFPTNFGNSNIKNDVVLRDKTWNSKAFDYYKANKAGPFAVECEELHPDSIVPKILPDVEYRYHDPVEGEKPRLIKDDQDPTKFKLFPTNYTIEQYKIVRALKENMTTIVKGCKEHLKHRFCKYSHKAKRVYTIRACDHKDKPLSIDVMLGDHLGMPYKGTNEHPNRHLIKVSCWVPDNLQNKNKDMNKIDQSLVRLRNNIIDLIDRSKKRVPKGNARKESEGLMWGYGHRSMTETFVTVRSRPREVASDSSYLNMQKIRELTKVVATDTATNMKHRHFKSTLDAIRASERQRAGDDDKNTLRFTTPCDSLGGSRGISCKFLGSMNYGNEFHYDADDLSRTFAHWIERYPGTAKNWYLVFPNMIVYENGVEYHGLRIELCDGAVVEWDGRVMKHCTTVTERGVTKDGKTNDVFAVAFVASRTKVDVATTKIPHMREPRVTFNNNHKVF